MGLVVDHFGGHVLWSAHEGVATLAAIKAWLRLLRWLFVAPPFGDELQLSLVVDRGGHDLGSAKVAHLEVPISSQEDVFWLEVCKRNMRQCVSYLPSTRVSSQLCGQTAQLTSMRDGRVAGVEVLKDALNLGSPETRQHQGHRALDQNIPKLPTWTQLVGKVHILFILACPQQLAHAWVLNGQANLLLIHHIWKHLQPQGGHHKQSVKRQSRSQGQTRQ